MTEHEVTPIVYLDANPFIYLIEGSDELASMMRDLFDLLRSRPKTAATSELTLAEVLPKAPSAVHRRSYLNLIVWSSMLELVPVARDILLETATYRRAASSGGGSMPKLPDAIHAVTAVRSGCRLFLTNDDRFKLPAHMRKFRTTSDEITALMKELA